MAHAMMEKELESMLSKKKVPPRPPPPYSVTKDAMKLVQQKSMPIAPVPPPRPPSLDGSQMYRDRACSDQSTSNRQRTSSSSNLVFKKDLESCISQKKQRGPKIPAKPVGKSSSPAALRSKPQNNQKSSVAKRISNPIMQPPTPTPRTKSPVQTVFPVPSTKPTAPAKPTSLPSSKSSSTSKLTSIKPPSPTPRTKSPVPPSSSSKPTSPPYTSSRKPSNTATPHLSTLNTLSNSSIHDTANSAPVTPVPERRSPTKKQPAAINTVLSSSFQEGGRGNNTVVHPIKGLGSNIYTKTIQLSKSASILDVPAVKVDLTSSGKYKHFPRPAPPNPLHRSQTSLVDLENRVYAIPKRPAYSLDSNEAFVIEPYAATMLSSIDSPSHSDDDNVYVEMQINNTLHYDQPRQQTLTTIPPNNSLPIESENIYANDSPSPDNKLAAYMPLTFNNPRDSTNTQDSNVYTGLVRLRKIDNEEQQDNVYSVPSSGPNISERPNKDSGGYVSLSPTKIEDNIYQDLSSSTRVTSY